MIGQLDFQLTSRIQNRLPEKRIRDINNQYCGRSSECLGIIGGLVQTYMLVLYSD